MGTVTKILVVHRPRRFAGLKQCKVCLRMFEWSEMARDPWNTKAFPKPMCFDCVDRRGHMLGVRIAWQQIFGDEYRDLSSL